MPPRKVTYLQRNFQCKFPNSNHRPTLAANDYWSYIGDPSGSISYSTVIGNVAPEEEFEWLGFASADNCWSEVLLSNGVYGYVRHPANGQGTYTTSRSEPYVTDEDRNRSIKSQFFRVDNISIDTSSRMATVHATHISYDYSGRLVGALKVSGADAQMCIRRIQQATVGGFAPRVFTNCTDSITADWSDKSVISALLDPDSGLASLAKAKVIRDNKDFVFIRNDFDSEDYSNIDYTITFGRNLQNVKWTRSTENIVNYVIPKSQNGNSTVYGSIVYPSAVDYPVSKGEYLALSVNVGDAKEDGTTYDLPAIQAKMQTDAEARFNDDHVHQAVTTIEVSFIELGDTVEFERYRGRQVLHIYDKVLVQAPDIGLNAVAQVTSYEWDAILERYNSIRLTDAAQRQNTAMSGYELRNGAVDYAKLSYAAIQRIRST